MKRLMAIPVITLGIGLALLIGCGEKAGQATQDKKKGVQKVTKTAKEMGTKAKEAMESGAALTKEKMNAYLGELKGQLDNIDTQVGELSGRTEMLGDATREKFKEQLAALTEKKEAAAMKMEELQGLSGEAWEKTKQELDKLMVDLTQSYENIKKEISGP